MIQSRAISAHPPETKDASVPNIRAPRATTAATLFAQPLVPMLTVVAVTLLTAIAITAFRTADLVAALWAANALAVGVWLRSGRGLSYDLSFGGMMAFAVRADSSAGVKDAQNRFVSNLKVITSAVSLGHDESLIVHVDNSGPRVAAYPAGFREFGHLRFSVGLEDVDDLIADLSAAPDATFD